jgi:signal transduction histidine kinase
MWSEIVLAVLALGTGFLVIGDFARTRHEILPEHANETPHDVRPRMVADTRSSRPGAFLREPADVHDAGPARRAESIGPVRRDHPYSPTGPSPAHTASRRGLKDWPVRSRLLLLVITPAVAVAVVAFCVVRIADILRGAPNHSPSTGAILSTLAIGAVMIIVLTLASWFTIIVARSVLHPLNRLRVGAIRMSRAVLPAATRRDTESNGDGGPSDSESIGIDSSDEIGQVARAFDQMRREILRLSTSETAVRGNLDAMCVNLSQRSQSLAERQMRLIQSLEQGEQDRQRLASLFKMNHIAARMHRNSQNLLLVAGRDLATSWNQPVALVNVIRAAVSEIEEYERVSLNAQPDIAVRGPAVNDVVHLLAELIENATSFSAAEMSVEISGQLLTSGGVLVDVTDRGVGMSAKEMAYANWQLENQSAKEINVLKWMGLFVVARLAARHGIRVRLQQAEVGGLTALVWLPDEVVEYQGSAVAPRLDRFGDAGSRMDPREAAAVHPGHAATERRVTSARSTGFATGYEETRDPPLGRRLRSDAGRGPAVRRPGPGLSEAMGEYAGAPGQPDQVFGDEAAGDITGGTLLTGRPSDEGSVVVPPAEDPEQTRRLPIFDAVESHWFSGNSTAPGRSGPNAVAGSGWASPADEGWRAAQTVDSPSSGGQTAAGLPRRSPNANLIPGAIPSTQPALPNRSAAAARDRLAGFQRGVTEGRAAAGGTADPAGQDES